MSRHVCDNCGRVWKDADLREIMHLEQRIDAGGVVPSGECKHCGCLCYPEKKVKPSRGEQIVGDAIALLGFYEGLVASLLDGNKKPDKAFLRALVKLNKKNTRNLKRLLP